MTTIVAAMTDPAFDSTVIIMAGYKDEVTESGTLDKQTTDSHLLNNHR